MGKGGRGGDGEANENPYRIRGKFQKSWGRRRCRRRRRNDGVGGRGGEWGGGRRAMAAAAAAARDQTAHRLRTVHLS